VRDIVLQLPQLPSTDPVSDRILISVWKKISDKPIPEVYAFTFDDRDFLRMVNLLQTTPGMISTRGEYGLGFDNKNVEARTFQFKDTFIILIKQDAPLSDCLEHELRQIKF
jgi:hypothetical protein